ncbi:MAG: hypothetical protein L3J67_03410 [Hyphomicrobiaceae bacterium]|nr:hypothetical protein [Hyphomicrobiaceae bacterium]
MMMKNMTVRPPKQTLIEKRRQAAMLCALTFALFITPLLSGSAGHTAKAQSIANSFGGLSKDNKEPINIEADTLEVLDDKNIAIFSGNVKVRQGKFNLVSKKLTVTYSRGSSGKKKGSEQKGGEPKGIKWIDATGKVVISTPDNQSATADWAKFDVLAKLVTIGGNVILSQSGNVMKGDKLVIDLNTGRSKFHSTSTQTSGKKGTKQKKPRISGVFYPGKFKGKNPLGKSSSPAKAKSNKAAASPPVPKKNPRASSNVPLPWQGNR